MTVYEYIKNVLDKWPDKISMKGAKYIPQSNGFFFPDLICIHDKFQDNCADDFEGVVEYEIFGLFFHIMKNLLTNGVIRDVLKTEINLDELVSGVRKEVQLSENFEWKDRLKIMD